MKEYKAKEFNQETLEFLKKNTILGPISLVKISKLKNEIDKAREWYQKLEGETIDTNYSLADELEYELRFKAWMLQCSEIWKQLPDNIGLLEFSELALEYNVSKNKSKKSR